MFAKKYLQLATVRQCRHGLRAGLFNHHADDRFALGSSQEQNDKGAVHQDEPGHKRIESTWHFPKSLPNQFQITFKSISLLMTSIPLQRLLELVLHDHTTKKFIIAGLT